MRVKKDLLHTPEGVRDIYETECDRKIALEEKLLSTLRSYGYHAIETPTFEYFDIFGKEIGTTPSRELYKFFDREGNTLVLRPDVTPQIARAAAKYYMEEDTPLRFCYKGNTFINNSSLQGRLKEVTQIGAELISDDTVEADAEIVAMAVDCIRKAGQRDFQLRIGHAGYFSGLIEAAGLSPETAADLRELIENKNFFGVEELIDPLPIAEDLKELFCAIGRPFGSAEELSSLAAAAAHCPKVQTAIQRLTQLEKALERYEVREYISYELGMIGGYEYYTGIVFAGFSYGSGEPIVKGGRYDRLLSYFGKNAPAIGFAFVTDQLLSAITRQKEVPKEEGEKYLTFALTKGRLAEKTLEMLEKIGIHCEEMKDKHTRKLIFVNEELHLKFFLAKGPDVPTYVEYGAADIGVVGRDTIVEEGRNVFEVMDLGFGKCRMCVCGPESAGELLKHHEMIRVATKYPRIAKDYFFNKKHQTVEIIKMNGSIELAPIVGLSEVICDIVETGSTLKENGLVVLEEICPLSARMIVNQVSMRMENERITKLIEQLRGVL